ncbi:acireductone synthase [Acidiphilium sp. PA]|uniref:acireductone synthase n=1 Tax=Acidiphilium sp. PA TaxID=2871705 RepID=UPI00224413AD|nr:acireductone synthase [Acidiphilium sp. PA]MCW8305522.1 acireductone synthase [Acidiphilium sp. PA]
MPDTAPPAVVLLDIEGTIAPISFVHDVLFPYARVRLARFLASHASEPDIVAALAELDRITPGAPPLETLLALMDRDAKLAPLKHIQGRIWAQGFADGALTSDFYADVLPTLQAWHDAGTTLAVYSSGSEQAQRLLFRHSPAGDRLSLISEFFDTRMGPKREAASYAAIARSLAAPAGSILFLSDVDAELTAAAAAGFAVCQLVRPADGTLAGTTHPHAANLTSVARQFGLSQPQ